MSGSPWESLVEVPREGMGRLTQFVPDTPWTTTTLQALQNRKASVYVDVAQHPRNLVIIVKGGDEAGEHDQAYLYGLPNSDGLRSYVSGLQRATEFVVDDELAPMLLEIHPDAMPRESVCCWFDGLELPPVESAGIVLRRLRSTDADAALKLLPTSAFRTFDSPKDMILGGGCYGVEIDGEVVSIAYVADKSVKYARVAAVTAEPYQRRGFAFAALRKLMETCVDDGRLVCALAPRRSAPAVHLALKLGFTEKALLRTYRVVPQADQPPVASTSRTTHSHS